MRKSIAGILVMAVSFTACGTTTVGVAVASLGIAGVALETYCATGGAGCSPALMQYGQLIITEASKDALILESGQATTAQIQAIVDDLTLYLAGAAIPGLTPQQQQEISAISAAISVLLPLVRAILPPAPNLMVKLPPLSGKDRSALSKMTVKLAAVRKP